MEAGVFLVGTGPPPANSSPSPTCQTRGPEERVQVKEEGAGCSRHCWLLQTLTLPVLCQPLQRPCWSCHIWRALGLWGQDHVDLGPLLLSVPTLPAQRSSAALCPYLEGLQESPVAPVLKLVLLRAESQHGLCVGMELVVKIVQEGGPRPVLGGRRVEMVERAPESRGAPDAWLRAAALAKCILVTVWS